MARTWQDLAPTQRRFIVIGGVVEAVLTTIAFVDLVRRPREKVRGPKALWMAGLVVQPIGPVAYLLLGRRHRSSEA